MVEAVPWTVHVVNVIHIVAVVLFLTALMFAALYDMVTFRIPNWVSITIACSFLAAAIASAMSVSDVALHIGAGSAMLAVGIALYSARVIGGGDAKLLAAVALWMGFKTLVPFLVIVAMFGGVLAIVVIIARKIFTPVSRLAKLWFGCLLSTTQGLPYGVAIAAGAVVVVLRLGNADPLFHVELVF